LIDAESVQLSMFHATDLDVYRDPDSTELMRKVAAAIQRRSQQLAG
jgi:hypothetical protein